MIFKKIFKNGRNQKKTKSMNVLVTGSAGFIGSFLVRELLSQNYSVVGIDNLNDYYDKNLKKARLSSIDNYVRESNISKNINL